MNQERTKIMKRKLGHGRGTLKKGARKWTARSDINKDQRKLKVTRQRRKRSKGRVKKIREVRRSM